MSRVVWRFLTVSTITFLACLGGSDPARAVEGQIGLYLLGTRDLAMGIVPKPGWYFSNDTVFLKG